MIYVFVVGSLESQKKTERQNWRGSIFLGSIQSYIYQVLQTIQMKLILLCVWAEPAVSGSTKIALKF